MKKVVPLLHLFDNSSLSAWCGCWGPTDYAVHTTGTFLVIKTIKKCPTCLDSIDPLERLAETAL